MVPVKRYRTSRWDDAGNVRCGRCRVHKSPDAFRTFVERKTGRTYPRAECRACENVRRQLALSRLDDAGWATRLERRRERERRRWRRQSERNRHERGLVRDWALRVFDQHGLTFAEAGRRVGVHPTSIRRWSDGSVPDPVMVDRLIDAATRLLAESERRAA